MGNKIVDDKGTKLEHKTPEEILQDMIDFANAILRGK